MVNTASPQKDATDPGFDSDLPAVVEKIDFCATEDELPAEPAADETAAEDSRLKRVYFVRVPRPPIDDNGQGQLKKLQDEFQAHVAKLKKLNTKLQAKREDVRELRRQMAQARSLKGESQPEFEEKLERLKQLRDLRNGYQTKISDIKTALKGLECKSEAELDAKIKECEHRIAHDNVELREEKQIVKQIGLLNSQRQQVKDYDGQKGSLAEMEAEVGKIKAIIDDMGGDFSILKGERDSAQKIISDIYAKLQVAEKAMKEVEEEQADLVRAKNEALESLDSLRDSLNADMKDYRANRKFSMTIRDMIADGQVEEAQALCSAQVEEWATKLDGDAKFRAEYTKLWASQRRYAVSELLPESSAEVMAMLAASKNASKGGKGAKGAPAAGAPRVAQGAEKAKALIDSLMQEASKEAAQKVARQRALAPRDESDHDADVEDDGPVTQTPGEILTAQLEAAAKKSTKKEPAQFVANPNAKAFEVFNAKVELPQVNVPDFELPVTSGTTTETLSKEQVRQEQMRKAREAEERKKRRAEQAEEKRIRAVERQKQLEAEAKVAEAKAAAQKLAAQRAADAAARAAADVKRAAEAEAAAKAAAKAAASNPLLKNTVVASAKRPASKGVDKKLKKAWQQNQTLIVVGCFLVFMLILLVLYSMM